MRLLIVKTTSLGDVIHCLPALTDCVGHAPHVEVDWVVEETYTGIVGLHPAVSRILPVAVRRWRRSLTQRATWDEFASFKRQLRPDGYDCIIDAQGLLKSAALARLARGTRHGFDSGSAREGLAARLYHKRHHVPWTIDAVARNRQLFGHALGYLAHKAPDYGIKAAPLKAGWLPKAPYCVLISGTTDAVKMWPEERWAELGRTAIAGGLQCVLTHGTENEERRAERLAQAIGAGAHVAPKLDLVPAAGLIAGARLVIGVDTGLTHLAGALDKPVVGIYCGTNPQATGVIARHAVNVGGITRTPTADAVWEAGAALIH